MADATPFDRAMSLLEMPDVRSTRPSTIIANNALLGHTGTHVVQTAYHPEDGFTVFLQVIDTGAITQVCLPHAVCAAIRRQMQRASARPKRKPTAEEAQRAKLRAARALLREHREKRKA